MSIVACVKVYDGLVLGAESMTQLFGQVAGTPQPQPQFLKAFSNARKLFQLRQGPPGVGVLTYGAGNIGTRSIGSFFDEFAEVVEDNVNMSVAEITNGLLELVRPAYQVQYNQVPLPQQPAIGFYVAGYSPGEHTGSELEFVLPQGEVVNPRAAIAPFGASWRGIGLPFSRLNFGIDPRFWGILAAQGVAPAMIANIQREAATKLVSPIVFDGMPVQDAIGFCKFILETTIGVASYELGVPSCGGPLQIAVISRRKGFRWVAEPEYRV